ncbi:IdeS/Mac family cysteine endopeptidase [Streptococcus halichoeri]|uniref:IdeS/Mac family cysteine endopeptidase n=1 Tax=Streptococcus halichoeri TaxID=254785 RepID=UPI001358D791|nr:IdeS/Mac family cysteine endopeptidase [Streptococcus halichoeri]
MIKKGYSNSWRTLLVGIFTTIILVAPVRLNTIFAESSERSPSVTYNRLRATNITLIWTKGVTPLAPEQFIYTKDGLHAPYHPNQGWYDISKTTNRGGATLLCGAATAGNMLHWWFDQNKTEINSYLNKYPEKRKLFFHGKEMLDLNKVITTKNDHINSELFTYFKKKAFHNFSTQKLGVMPTQVLDMFINGYRMKLGDTKATDVSKGSTNPDTRDPRGGFFEHVFNRGNQAHLLTASHELKDQTLAQISDLIKNELESGKALALSHASFGENPNHVINIWGAAFDACGELEALYVTDSDTDGVVGMKKYIVTVNAAGKAILVPKPNEDHQEGYQLLGLYTLSTGQNIWQQSKSK